MNWDILELISCWELSTYPIYLLHFIDFSTFCQFRKSQRAENKPDFPKSQCNYQWIIHSFSNLSLLLRSSVWSKLWKLFGGSFQSEIIQPYQNPQAAPFQNSKFEYPPWNLASRSKSLVGFACLFLLVRTYICQDIQDFQEVSYRTLCRRWCRHSTLLS